MCLYVIVSVFALKCSVWFLLYLAAHLPKTTDIDNNHSLSALPYLVFSCSLNDSVQSSFFFDWHTVKIKTYKKVVKIRNNKTELISHKINNVTSLLIIHCIYPLVYLMDF